MSQRDIMRKADLAVSDLISDGGYLNPIQANTFIRGLIEQTTLLNEIRVVPMNAPTMEINKIGIGSRVLHGAPASGTELDSAKRTAPTTSKITLTTKEIMAEVHIPYDVLEDNIEREGIGATIMALVAEKASSDLEELVLLGDTTILPATDDLLCKCDGVLKRATVHVVDNTGAPVAVTLPVFTAGVKALPNKYLRNRPAMRHYVSPHAQLDFSSSLVSRNTTLGDAAVTNYWNPGPPAQGIPVASVALMPNSKGILTDPKNIILGIQRKITVETDKNIRTRELIWVMTMRIDVQVEETDAIVKYLGFNVT